ncbi:MAG: flavodoxin domain-containing protein, partial [Bacteroidota bacterium]
MEFNKDIKVGLFFGSDTGTTEAITQDFKELWNLTDLEVIEACDMKVEDYAPFNFIILGLPTWYDGDLQSDFEDFFDDFKTIDFTDKIVAMYGLGDQYGYAEYFVDGLGILGKVILENGGKIIGHWP